MIYVETAKIKHELAARYFASRNFWFLYLPIQLLMGVSSALAFMASSDSFSSVVADRMTLSVGIIAAVSALITAVERLLNFKSRADMHRAAEQILEKTSRELDFTVMKHRLERNQGLASQNELELEKFEKQFAQIEESCTSAFPGPIKIAFYTLHTSVDAQLATISTFPTVQRMKILRAANSALAIAITNRWSWPCALPSQAAVDVALHNLVELLAHDIEEQRLDDKQTLCAVARVRQAAIDTHEQQQQWSGLAPPRVISMLTAMELPAESIKKLTVREVAKTLEERHVEPLNATELALLNKICPYDAEDNEIQRIFEKYDKYGDKYGDRHPQPGFISCPGNVLCALQGLGLRPATPEKRLACDVVSGSTSCGLQDFKKIVDQIRARGFREGEASEHQRQAVKMSARDPASDSDSDSDSDSEAAPAPKSGQK